MKPTDEKGSLSVGEVCDILTLCRTAGVAKMKFRDLDVEFSPKGPEPTIITQSLSDLTIPELTERYKKLKKPVSTPPATDLAEQQAQAAEKALVADEIELREQQLAELWVTDPAKAEQLLMSGELRDDEPDETEET